MANEKDKLVRDQPAEIPTEQGPLAIYKGAQPPAPKWFEEAVATQEIFAAALESHGQGIVKAL